MVNRPKHSGLLQEAYDCGYEAGEQMEHRDDNPHEPHTALYAWWDAGWCQALDDLCVA